MNQNNSTEQNVLTWVARSTGAGAVGYVDGGPVASVTHQDGDLLPWKAYAIMSGQQYDVTSHADEEGAKAALELVARQWVARMKQPTNIKDGVHSRGGMFFVVVAGRTVGAAWCDKGAAKAGYDTEVRRAAKKTGNAKVN